MPAGHKYRAKTVYWDTTNLRVVSPLVAEEFRVNGRLKLPPNLIRFDSIHEFKVYYELTRLFGTSRIKRQHPIDIFPIGYCYPRGKTWKVDFVISSITQPEEYDYLIEAKGAVLSEFEYTLGILETRDCDSFEKLRIIFPRTIPKDKRIIKSLLDSDFGKNLLTLQELEKARCLP